MDTVGSNGHCREQWRSNGHGVGSNGGAMDTV